MAARTALTATSGVRNSSAALGASGTVDATNGNTIAAPGGYKLLLLVANADTSDHTCTIRATGSGVDASGNAQTSPYPSNAVFAEGSQGDLVANCAHGSAPANMTVIGPLETDRFAQADGSVSIDWSSSTSMSVWAFRLPYNVV